ncbi:MAG: hypothetical protein LBF62_02860 [Tannerellaceae bacterium]|jgi:predicted amidophosphoribosyltransferase|nr:hypothetical protein [Tannerellaceae bacterium]
MFEQKKCLNCGANLSVNTKVGDYCPACGGRFAGEKRYSFQDAQQKPLTGSAKVIVRTAGILFCIGILFKVVAVIGADEPLIRLFAALAVGLVGLLYMIHLIISFVKKSGKHK